MSESGAYEDLRSGAAWEAFCDGLKEAGRDLMRETAPKSPVDVAEGHRFLTRMLRSAFELIMEAGDPRRPEFFTSLHSTLKSGWDNPDNIHLNAYLDGNLGYRVWGTRGDSHYMSFGIYGGSFGKGGGRRTVAYVPMEKLEVAPDGTFEVVLSKREHPGNWIEIAPDATTLMVRQTFWDRSVEEPAQLRIERLGAETPEPLSPDFVTAALRRSLRYVRGSNKIFFDLSDMWQAKPNVFWPTDREKAEETIGIRGMSYLSGWWECPAGHAVVTDVVPPQCRYWGMVLSNYWGESFEYRYRTVDVNQRNARYRPDGSIRFVICAEDPGLPDANWLDTESHPAGIWTLRWLEADSEPVPEVRVVPVETLGDLA